MLSLQLDYYTLEQKVFSNSKRVELKKLYFNGRTKTGISTLTSAAYY